MWLRMTCIVGLVDQETGDVWMGGDSAGAAGHHLEIRTQPKVFLKGPVVVGYTTSFRMGQLLQYQLKVPAERDENDELIEPFEWMVTKFVEAIRSCLKDGGFAQKKDEVETGGTFLVGYRGRLFSLYDDYQVAELTQPFNVVGCAWAYALGVLEVMVEAGRGPEECVLRALAAAERFSGAVSEPFSVVRLPGGVR